MNKQPCFTCGTVFDAAFPIFKCNVCQQTDAIKKAMEKQPRPVQTRSQQSAYTTRAAPIYTRFTEDDKKQTFESPTEEQSQRKKQLRTLDNLFSLGLLLSLPTVWVLVWLLTSGWVTFICSIAAMYIPFYLYEKQEYWRYKNHKYLYQI